VKAYHFLREDMTAGSGNEPPWTVGETRRMNGKLSLCERGYHSSPTPADALRYPLGPILCLVEVSEPVMRDKTKQVSASRTLLKAVDVLRTLHEQACRIARDVLPIWERRYPQDMRPRRAIEAKEAWLRGELSDEALQVARADAAAAG